MRICPKCRTAYPPRGRSTCAKDGTRLVDSEEYAASRNDPLIGRCIAGRFQVVERVGTGGMGTVYRAEQSGLDRAVALKVLKKELISDRDTVARFHREAKAMSLLMHPNTVRVFDFGEDEKGYLFLAMELLEGELLTSWIEREETPPVDEAVEVVQEILRSLGEAHSKGIIHRDLKPDNIFLHDVDSKARPVVKVLDFGIAKVFREDGKLDQLETQAGTVFGTPRYMSPEQAQGKPLDPRSDLYAVGVLLYQLLTGRPPFLDDDAVVVMAKHIRDTPEPPRQVAPHRPIPRSLEKIVQKALAKETKDRFRDADAFDLALTESLADVELEMERLRSGRHSRMLLSVGGLPLVPLAIGAALIMMAVGIASFLVLSSGPGEVAARDTTPSRTPTRPLDEPAVGVGIPAPTTVPVVLSSAPIGADIWSGDELLGQTPREFALDADEEMLLTLRLHGHEPADVELRAEAAPRQVVPLVPAPGDTPSPSDPPRVGPRATGPRTTGPRTSGRPPRTEQPETTPPSGTPEPSGDPYERW